MKRSANIKDSIMMPPPKARPKSRSDTSEELRKNLNIESIISISDNPTLQEDFHKFFRENEELELRKMDDELSISKSTSSNNFDKLNPLGLGYSPQVQCICSNLNNTNSCLTTPNCQSCLRKYSSSPNCNASFNFNLVNYNYNYTQFSDDEENVESLEKLRRNLITSNTSNQTDLSGVKSLSSSKNTANFIYKTFPKLPPPQNKKEVKLFVSNMLTYICEHEFDSTLLILKIKIQTRDNDFRNKGLKFDYYRDSLLKMQRELITRICMFNEEEKKIEKGSFELIKKKRKRSEQSEGNNKEKESSSSSDEKSEGSGISSFSNKSANSSKSIKQVIKKI
jgi:hypothetical protein